MNGREENDSGSHCIRCWKLGPLIGIYTPPCCRAVLHLGAAAECIGKLKASQFCWIPREPSVVFWLRVLLPFYQRAALGKFLFPQHVLLGCITDKGSTGHMLGRSHHSRLRWASSCLNRSIQKPTGEEGFLFSFENFMIKRTFKN